MMKYLILIALALGAWWFWRRATYAPRAGEPEAAPPESMARCTYCDVYCPQGDMVTDANGHLYCTPAHRDQHHKGHSARNNP